MENRIKECQADLFADRTSTATMRVNQLRPWFASMAYVLVCALRPIGLCHTDFAEAICGTIRLKFFDGPEEAFLGAPAPGIQYRRFGLVNRDLARRQNERAQGNIERLKLGRGIDGLEIDGRPLVRGRGLKPTTAYRLAAIGRPP
jgi:hypothetical protein